jgi:hypothetical protein
MTIMKDGDRPDPPGKGRNAFFGYIRTEVVDGDHSEEDGVESLDGEPPAKQAPF